jgi:hypothetical protein
MGLSQEGGETLLKKPKISTATQIRDLLKARGSAYVWQLWHILRFERKATRMRYASFVSYFKTLERLGLVLRVDPPKTQPPIPKYRRTGRLKSVPRVWFALNPRKVNSSEWTAPERSLYPETFKVTGRPRGRPPGSKNKPKKT